MTHRLLLLSGDVEMNPGPLGQHNEGEMVQCVRLVLIKSNGSDCSQILNSNTSLWNQISFHFVFSKCIQ